MEDENLDLEEGQSVESSQLESNRQLNRTKDLADKLRQEREEREKLQKEKAEIEAEKANTQKEVEFYKGFSTVVGKYAAAGEYQDQIREKVLNGYDVEDATISVLAKEGKFNPSSVPRSTPAGGSATNNLPTGEQKSVAEMNVEEMRSALLEAEAKGDISLS